MMMRCVRYLVVAAGLMAPLGFAHAAGTLAGSIVTNTAKANYSVGGVAAPEVQNSVDFTVDEIIDIDVTWQDAADVVAGSPETGAVLEYLVTNTGNGNEAVALSASQGAGGVFDPAIQTIYYESNGTPGLQTGPGGDTLYSAGANDPNLAADGAVAVYVVSDIPAGLTSGDIGDVQLTAQATTPGAAAAAAGDVLSGAGDLGSDAVISDDGAGGNGSNGDATGNFVVSAVSVSVAKTIVSVTNPIGGAPSEEIPGADVRYQIAVTVSGTGTAENLVITDEIPANTTFKAASITLDGAIQTDASDGADGTDFGVSAGNTVTVDLGTVIGPASYLIELTVNID